MIICKLIANAASMYSVSTAFSKGARGPSLLCQVDWAPQTLAKFPVLTEWPPLSLAEWCPCHWQSGNP